MEKQIKDQIIKEYNAITDFSNGALAKLAAKYGITVDKLLDIIPL